MPSFQSHVCAQRMERRVSGEGIGSVRNIAWGVGSGNQSFRLAKSLCSGASEAVHQGPASRAEQARTLTNHLMGLSLVMAGKSCRLPPSVGAAHPPAQW